MSDINVLAIVLAFVLPSSAVLLASG